VKNIFEREKTQTIADPKSREVIGEATSFANHSKASASKNVVTKPYAEFVDVLANQRVHANMTTLQTQETGDYHDASNRALSLSQNHGVTNFTNQLSSLNHAPQMQSMMTKSSKRQFSEISSSNRRLKNAKVSQETISLINAQLKG